MTDSTRVPKTFRQVERREWWMSWSAIAVTLVLTAGITSLAFVLLGIGIMDSHEASQTRTAVQGLISLVFLFDLYAIYQQLQVHRIRRTLLDQEELFRLISENAVDMIAVVDASGRRLYNSPSYERILGYTQEELSKSSPWEQIHPEDLKKVQDAARMAIAKGVGRSIDYRMKHKDGHWILIESTASTVVDSQGRVDKLVIVNRNIDERRRLEDQFRQAQKMEAIGRLSGGIAHDFNNLLGVIMGYCEILQIKVDQANPIRNNLDQIFLAAKRAADLTRQLLAFSRQQVLEPGVFVLNSVVSNIEPMLRRVIGEDIELTISLDKHCGKLRADLGQLGQVLMNLVVNSRDAMPNGGKLCIETSNVELDELFIRKWPFPVTCGRYILLSVTDTGVGMDSATQQRIFEPFFTTKEKSQGTGLGLSMVYGVVKQSGGYIDVYSHPGVGTTIKIYLPQVDEETPTTESHTRSLAIARGNETILLVEDEEGLRTVTQTVLESLGYRVLSAANGQDALETARTFTGDIDLLFTDMVMPGMNGQTLANEISKVRPGTKTLLMSGYTGQGIGLPMTFSPGTIFLQKPFTRSALSQKILDALRATNQCERPESRVIHEHSGPVEGA
jgi:two-component system, cell cycle sensor histidine kinase and response regulator CckA